MTSVEGPSIGTVACQGDVAPCVLRLCLSCNILHVFSLRQVSFQVLPSVPVVFVSS